MKHVLRIPFFLIRTFHEALVLSFRGEYFMFNKLNVKNVLLLFCFIYLVGCATRPPSAVIFMTSPKQSDSQNSAAPKSSVLGGVSITGLTTVNAEKTGDVIKETPYEIHKEWNFNLNVQGGSRYGYFAYGFGLQMTYPYGYIGFASDHFGTMVWSNIFPLLALFEGKDDEDYGYYAENKGFGVSLIEQIELNNGMKVGLTQHFSRTVAAYTEHGGGFPANWPSSFYFYEFGGGGYLSIPVEAKTIGIEASISRNYTYKAYQFSLMVDYII